MIHKSEGNSERPFYLIAHKTNSIRKIRKAARQGVNALECDVLFDKKWFVSHDGFIKRDLKKWLQFLNGVQKMNLFRFILFDIKNGDEIDSLRSIVDENLSTDLARIYSVPKISDAKVFSAMKELKPYEGLSIDAEDDPSRVKEYFNVLNVKQCLYGNGITLIPVNGTFHESMKQAAEIRDNGGPFSKIYSWTINRKVSMEKYVIEDGVDGLMVDLNGLLFKPVLKARKLVAELSWLKMADRTDALF